MRHHLSAIPADETDNSRYEKSLGRAGYSRIAGCDEAGRGPLAGPVVAAAVILKARDYSPRLKDSKALSAKKREELYTELHLSGAQIGIGIVSHELIDKINILQASLLAMKLACLKLVEPADYLLVDGKFEVPLAIAQQALVKGESKSCSIAAASIIAKVSRDRLMQKLHLRYPQYNFQKNQGYPTRQHREALKQYGPCPAHRLSFKGVVQDAR